VVREATFCAELMRFATSGSNRVKLGPRAESRLVKKKRPFAGCVVVVVVLPRGRSGTRRRGSWPRPGRRRPDRRVLEPHLTGGVDLPSRPRGRGRATLEPGGQERR
jgi:hypothetical protein